MEAVLPYFVTVSIKYGRLFLINNKHYLKFESVANYWEGICVGRL